MVFPLRRAGAARRSSPRQHLKFASRPAIVKIRVVYGISHGPPRRNIIRLGLTQRAWENAAELIGDLTSADGKNRRAVKILLPDEPDFRHLATAPVVAQPGLAVPSERQSACSRRLAWNVELQRLWRPGFCYQWMDGKLFVGIKPD